MKYILFAFSIACLGCGNDNSNVIRAYYPLDSLLNEQNKYFSTHPADLRKISNQDTIIVPSDSINWSNELEIFKTLDINKPALVDAYSIQDGLNDSTSNLTILRYTSKYGDQSVNYLELHYLRAPYVLKRIKAQVVIKNGLFSSSREFNMEFGQTGKQTILYRYSISGAQKLMMTSSVDINILTEIIY